MNDFTRSNITLVKAREIISRLEIEEPSEIDIELIAFNQGASVMERPLTGADGRMVRSGGAAMITVRESIRFPGQKLFVIAHELGHVLLHPYVRQIDEVKIAQASNWSRNQEPEEVEANLFAAEILMPRNLFMPRIEQKDPSFELLRNLAADFRTTLTATAIQFLRYTKEECVLVCSKNGRRKWFWPTERFSFRLRDEMEIHDYTCAAELAKFGGGQISGNDVPAGSWFRDFSVDGMECVTEDAIYSNDFNETLSLVWVHDAI